MPIRIQRQRTKGWRMPRGAVYVGRPSKWGNPFAVKRLYDYGYDRQAYGVLEAVELGQSGVTVLGFTSTHDSAAEARQRAVRLYRAAIENGRLKVDASPLRGRDLVCWCPLDQPCHADVLLEIANREPPR